MALLENLHFDDVFEAEKLCKINLKCNYLFFIAGYLGIFHAYKKSYCPIPILIEKKIVKYYSADQFLFLCINLKRIE
jgi:hypothetical protein